MQPSSSFSIQPCIDSNRILLGSTELQLYPDAVNLYRIKKSSYGFLISLFSFIAESWTQALFDDIANREEVKKRKFVLRNECREMMQLILNNCFEAVENPARGIPLPRRSEVRCWKSLQTMTFLEGEKFILFSDISNRQMEILEDLPDILPLNQLNTSLAKVRKRIHSDWDILLRDCNYKLVEKDIHLSGEDRAFLQLDSSEPSPNLHALDCSGYAFFKTREKLAISWIRDCKAPDEFYYGDSFLFLDKWGYKTIDHPIPGCLVLYFSDVFSPRRPDLMHTAVYLDMGFVQSKLGMYNAVYEHRLTDVPAIYGKIVIFMARCS